MENPVDGVMIPGLERCPEPMFSQDDLQTELAVISQVLQEHPNDHNALRRLAQIGGRLGDQLGREQTLRLLLHSYPDDGEAWADLAATVRCGSRLSEAGAICQAALRIQPDNAKVHLEQALIEEAAGRFEQAREALDHLVTIAPLFFFGFLERYYFFMRRGDAVLALAAADDMITSATEAEAEATGNDRRAIAADLPISLVCRAVALHHLEHFAEADAACLQAMAKQPTFAPAHFTRGFNLLRMGQWREGYAEFEWRLQMFDSPKAPLPLPKLSLADPPGTRVLVWSDQGLGDVLHHIRFIHQLQERGYVLSLHVPASLARLIRSMPQAPAMTTVGETPSDADRQISFGSLPWLFGADPDTAWHGPYLTLPSKNPRIGTLSPEKLAVGIVWAGSSLHANDRFRSSSLADLAPLFDLPGVDWYSLQLKRSHEPLPTGMIDLAPKIGDFADTAALLTQLDVLVSVDTSICHLAGALGIPAYVLLPHSFDWRWRPGEGISSWYPSLRLYRQQRVNDWSAPVTAVREQLATLAIAKRKTGTIV